MVDDVPKSYYIAKKISTKQNLIKEYEVNDMQSARRSL